MLRMLTLTPDLTIKTRQCFRAVRLKSRNPFIFSSISTHLGPIPTDSYSWWKPGFPRFRSFRRYDSITFPSYGDGCRLLDGGKLRIQGAGLVKVKLHRPVEGEIKTVTIRRDVNHWYVCFSVERDSVRLPESSEEIGMDVGLDSFAAFSNGREIDNPRHLKCGMAHLVRAQRRLSRRKRGSQRRRKAATLVAKAHRKIRNQRTAFHHKLSHRLVKRYGLIAVEDLNIKGLSVLKMF